MISWASIHLPPFSPWRSFLKQREIFNLRSCCILYLVIACVATGPSAYFAVKSWPCSRIRMLLVRELLRVPTRLPKDYLTIVLLDKAGAIRI